MRAPRHGWLIASERRLFIVGRQRVRCVRVVEVPLLYIRVARLEHGRLFSRLDLLDLDGRRLRVRFLETNAALIQDITEFTVSNLPPDARRSIAGPRPVARRIGGVINQEGITLGAHGIMYVQVSDPQPFLLQVVGGQPAYSREDLQAWLRPSIAGSMRAELASYTVTGLMGERDAFQESIVRRLSPVLEAWGLALRSIEVEDFNLPQEYREAAQAATITTLDRNAAVIAAQAQAEITRIEASASADKTLLEGAARSQYFAMLQAQGIDPVRIEWIRALVEYADHPGGGVGDMYKPQLFLQAGQILADPTIPARVKQDVRRRLPGRAIPQMTDPSAPIVQYPIPTTAPAAPDDTASPPGSGDDLPLTRERIQQLLDGLDMQLAEGELSEAAYDRLYARWEAKLNALP